MSLNFVFGHCHPQKAEPRSCSETVELTEPEYLLSGSYTVSSLISMMLRFLNNRCFPASQEEALAMLLTSEPEGSRPRWAHSGPDFWAQAILVGQTPGAAEEADRTQGCWREPQTSILPAATAKGHTPCKRKRLLEQDSGMGAVLMCRGLRRGRRARAGQSAGERGEMRGPMWDQCDCAWKGQASS